MNTQTVNDTQDSKESVSEISIPLITKFGFSAGGFVLVVLTLLILDSVKDFPQLWKNIIHWPWNVYHGIFGAIFGLIMAEFFWIYKQWWNFESGILPGWAKVAVPKSLETPEESVNNLSKVLLDIIRKKIFFLLVLSFLPFGIAILFELPYLKKDSKIFGEIWAHVIAGSLESIIIATVSCALYFNWVKFVDHWKLKAISGSIKEVKLSNELKLEEARLLEKIKDLEETKFILEGRIKQLEDGGIGMDNSGSSTSWPSQPQSGSPIPATSTYTPANLDFEKPRAAPKSFFEESPAWQPANINTNPNGFSDDVSNGVPLNPDDRPTVE